MHMQAWNDELASVAQSYAEQCIFEHNNDRVSQQGTFSSVGENLAMETESVANYTALVEGWNSQVENYNYEQNSCTVVCAAYTQVRCKLKHFSTNLIKQIKLYN